MISFYLFTPKKFIAIILLHLFYSAPLYIYGVFVGIKIYYDQNNILKVILKVNLNFNIKFNIKQENPEINKLIEFEVCVFIPKTNYTIKNWGLYMAEFQIIITTIIGIVGLIIAILDLHFWRRKKMSRRTFLVNFLEIF